MELKDINKVKFFTNLWLVKSSRGNKLVCLSEWNTDKGGITVNKSHLTFISFEDNEIIFRYSPSRKLSPEYIPLLYSDGENKTFHMPTSLYEIKYLLKTVTK